MEAGGSQGNGGGEDDILRRRLMRRISPSAVDLDPDPDMDAMVEDRNPRIRDPDEDNFARELLFGNDRGDSPIGRHTHMSNFEFLRYVCILRPLLLQRSSHLMIKNNQRVFCLPLQNNSSSSLHHPVLNNFSLPVPSLDPHYLFPFL